MSRQSNRHRASWLESPIGFPLVMTALALSLFVCLSARGAGAAGAGVTIQGLAYQPRAVTVTVGSAVTWSHRDSVTHTVTAADGTWDSGVLDFGASYSRVFDRPGSFDYFCRVHPTTMTGTVNVAGDPPPPDTVLMVPYRTFEPDVITVTAGTVVTWTNQDEEPHSTTANEPGLWDSPILRRGQSFSHRFAEPGTFGYICGLHPEMKGEIVVTGPAGVVYLPAITRSRSAGW